MAKVFLDTNYFIDAVARKPEKQILDSLKGNILFISILSLHIYCYIYKIKIPSTILLSQVERFQLLDVSRDLADKALLGPTNDFEDNVQLHSAAEADCNIFLKNDKKINDLKFFGKVKIDSAPTPVSS